MLLCKKFLLKEELKTHASMVYRIIESLPRWTEKLFFLPSRQEDFWWLLLVQQQSEVSMFDLSFWPVCSAQKLWGCLSASENFLVLSIAYPSWGTPPLMTELWITDLFQLALKWGFPHWPQGWGSEALGIKSTPQVNSFLSALSIFCSFNYV